MYCIIIVSIANLFLIDRLHGSCITNALKCTNFSATLNLLRINGVRVASVLRTDDDLRTGRKCFVDGVE